MKNKFDQKDVSCLPKLPVRRLGYPMWYEKTKFFIIQSALFISYFRQLDEQ